MGEGLSRIGVQPTLDPRVPSQEELWQHEAEETLIHGRSLSFEQFTDTATKQALVDFEFAKAWYIAFGYHPSYRALGAVADRAARANDRLLQTAEHLSQSAFGAVAYDIAHAAGASEETKFAVLQAGAMVNGATLGWARMPEVTRAPSTRLRTIPFPTIEPNPEMTLRVNQRQLPSRPTPAPIKPPRPTRIVSEKGIVIEEKFALCTPANGDRATPFFDVSALFTVPSDRRAPRYRSYELEMGEQAYLSREVDSEGRSAQSSYLMRDPVIKDFGLRGRDLLISWVRRTLQEGFPVKNVVVRYWPKADTYSTNYDALFERLLSLTGLPKDSPRSIVRDVSPELLMQAIAAAPMSVTLTRDLGFVQQPPEIWETGVLTISFKAPEGAYPQFSDQTTSPVPRPTYTVTQKGLVLERNYSQCNSADASRTTRFLDVSQLIKVPQEYMGRPYQNYELKLSDNAYFERFVDDAGRSSPSMLVLTDPDLRAFGLRGRDILMSWVRRTQMEGHPVQKIEVSYLSNSLHRTNFNRVLAAVIASANLPKDSPPSVIADVYRTSPDLVMKAIASAPSSVTLMRDLGFVPEAPKISDNGSIRITFNAPEGRYPQFQSEAPTSRSITGLAASNEPAVVRLPDGQLIPEKFAICTSADGSNLSPFFDLSQQFCEPFREASSSNISYRLRLSDTAEFAATIDANTGSTRGPRGVAVSMVWSDPAVRDLNLSSRDAVISWVRRAQAEGTLVREIDVIFSSTSARDTADSQAIREEVIKLRGLAANSDFEAVRDATTDQLRQAIAVSPTSLALMGDLGYVPTQVRANNMGSVFVTFVLPEGTAPRFSDDLVTPVPPAQVP